MPVLRFEKAGADGQLYLVQSSFLQSLFIYLFIHSFIYYLYSVHLLLGTASFAGDREIRKTETLEVERPSGCKKL